MVDKRDSEFISNYDSFAPPVEDVEPVAERGGGAGKLLIFLISLPSWIVAALFAMVIYSQVSHRPVNLGPVQIAASLNGSPMASPEGAPTEDLQKITQRLDELSSKIDALSASRVATGTSAAPSASAPLAGTPPASTSAASGAGASEASAPPSAEKSARATGGAAAAPAPKVAGNAGKKFNSAIAKGKELSEEIADYAREHGGSLGSARSRFVSESDQWLNTTYNLVQEKLGNNAALSFMAAEPSDTDVEGVGADDSRMVRSIQARVSALQRMGGGGAAAGASSAND